RLCVRYSSPGSYALDRLRRRADHRARVIHDLEAPVDPCQPEEPADRLAALDDRQAPAAPAGAGLCADDQPKARRVHEPEPAKVEHQRLRAPLLCPAHLFVEGQGAREVELTGDGDLDGTLFLPGLQGET